MGTLSGRTALVTGASRGIGRAIAIRLATEGAMVAVHYGHNEQAAKDTVAQIEHTGGHAVAIRAELGVPDDASTLWSAFDAALVDVGGEPGLDILVNNAGVVVTRNIAMTTRQEFDTLVAVNVMAPFFIVQEGLGRIRDNGRIINISSGVTRIAMPSTIAYSMTKGAIDVFTHTMARELGPRNITVNAVAPGLIATDMNDAWLRDNPIGQAYAAACSCLGRVGQPADVADIVAFLASPDARWTTGWTIDATGGAQL